MSDILAKSPLLFLFFAAIVAPIHPEVKIPEPFLLQLASFFFFTIIGPLKWIERSTTSSSNNSEGEMGLVAISDLLGEVFKRRFRFLLWMMQGSLLILGALLVALWLLDTRP